MTTANIRKIVTIIEETHPEADKPIRPATRRAAAVAVIENPFAGCYVEDLKALMVIGEELGFVALFVMILLFSIFMYRILSLSLNASDKFSGLILIGISSIFLSHIFVNCAMVSGMMPVKGLPLPFISYGGSFLISCFIMVGLILNFGREKSY